MVTDHVLQAAQARRDARVAGISSGSVERWHVITGAVGPDFASRLTVTAIKEAVSRVTRVSVAEIDGRSRTADIARARMIAMYLSRTLLKRSFPDIGKRFGGRDHSTAVHACQLIAERVKQDLLVAGLVTEARRRLAASC